MAKSQHRGAGHQKSSTRTPDERRDQDEATKAKENRARARLAQSGAAALRETPPVQHRSEILPAQASHGSPAARAPELPNLSDFGRQPTSPDGLQNFHPDFGERRGQSSTPPPPFEPPQRADPLQAVLDAWRASWSADESPRDMLDRFARLPTVLEARRITGTELIAVTLDTGETCGFPASRYFDVVVAFYDSSTPPSPVSEVEDVETPARLAPSGALQRRGVLRIS